MARARMVTRTIKTTVANVLRVYVDNAETQNETIVLSGTFHDDRAIIKAIAKQFDNEHVKTVKVNSAEPAEALYGMTEAEFIELAKVLK